MTENPQPRAIIAEDDLILREYLRHILTASACEVVGEADDGHETVELFREKEPDLVFLDIIMPNMDGLEALRQIKQHSPNAYIVMLTAVDKSESIEDAMILGAKDYIRKDLPPDQILKRVQRHIGILETQIQD